jgi:anti-sigma factor (TIGR02949 family)
MITCRELIDFLMSYMDGELPAEQRAEFERHLNACPPCRRYMATYEQTVQLSRQATAVESPPEPAPEALVQAILAARRGTRGER